MKVVCNVELRGPTGGFRTDVFDTVNDFGLSDLEWEALDQSERYELVLEELTQHLSIDFEVIDCE